MIKKDTILSTTDTRLTLLQWLKKVEKALKDSTVTGFTATPTEDGKVVFAMTFADGSTISTDPIAVPALLDKYIKLNADGNLLDFGLSGSFDGSELYLDGRLVRLRSYKEGVWDNVDVEIQNTAGQYITAIRIRKNDIDGRQVRVMPGGSMEVDDELFASTVYIGGRSYRLLQSGTSNSNDIEFQNQTPEGLFSTALKIAAKHDGSYSVFLHDTPIATKTDIIDLRNDVGNTYSKARYQHTVTIKFDNKNTAVLAFTAMSSNRQKVTSFQNLATVFGGRRLTCSGGDGGSRYIYLDTSQSDPNNYVVGYIDGTGFHTDETLGTLTGTGLTVEDDVSIP